MRRRIRPPDNRQFQARLAGRVRDEIADMRERFIKGGTELWRFHKQLFEKLWEYFAPRRTRREEILQYKSYIDESSPSARTRQRIANEVMDRVRKAVWPCVSDFLISAWRGLAPGCGERFAHDCHRCRGYSSRAACRPSTFDV